MNADPDKLWFTSDTHFGHRAMLNWRTPNNWSNTQEMDSHLIEQWNRNVQSDDTIIHLGDFSFRNGTDTLDVICQLRGRKILLLGNHDSGLAAYCRDMFDEVHHYLEAKVSGNRLIMGHFPFRSWHQMHYGSWNLHGHCHGNLAPQGLQLDVGVDSVNKLFGGFRPVQFWEIEGWMIGRKIELAGDHHTLKEKK